MKYTELRMRSIGPAGLLIMSVSAKVSLARQVRPKVATSVIPATSAPHRTPTRRKFLGQTAVAAASLMAALCFVPGRVLAARGRPGANDRINIGYIGAGRRALQLMDLPPEARIVAAADVQLSRAEEVAQRFGGRAFQDYRDLLDSKDVDAVIVATPDHWHALPSIHACQAGKDVYCEKPLTLTIREGRQMVDAARKHNRVVQTGSQQRSTVANRVACQWVRDGHLGKVIEVIGSNYPSPWHCADETGPSKHVRWQGILTDFLDQRIWQPTTILSRHRYWNRGRNGGVETGGGVIWLAERRISAYKKCRFEIRHPSRQNGSPLRICHVSPDRSKEPVLYETIHSALDDHQRACFRRSF